MYDRSLNCCNRCASWPSADPAPQIMFMAVTPGALCPCGSALQSYQDPIWSFMRSNESPAEIPAFLPFGMRWVYGPVYELDPELAEVLTGAAEVDVLLASTCVDGAGALELEGAALEDDGALEVTTHD